MATNEIDPRTDFDLDDQTKETHRATPFADLLCERVDTAFCNSQEEEKFKQMFGDCEGPELLISILKKFQEDGLFGAWETALVIYTSLSSLTLSFNTGVLETGLKELIQKITAQPEKVTVEERAAIHILSVLIVHGTLAAWDNHSPLKEQEAAEIMKPYLNTYLFIKPLCMITLVYIVEEGQKYSSAEHRTDITGYLVRLLRDALQSTDKTYRGLRDREIVIALGRLAVQDRNKYKIVKNGGVPLLIEMLKSENSHTQQAAAKALRNLAFSDEVRHELLNDGDFLKVLESVSKSTDSSTSDAAREALWVITEG